MVRYALPDILEAMITTEALHEAAESGAVDVTVTIGEGEHKRVATLKKPFWACIPFFQQKFSFEEGVREQTATTVVDRHLRSGANTGGQIAKRPSKMTIELPDFLNPTLFWRYFLPWLMKGITAAELGTLNCYGYAHGLKMFDYFQCPQDATKLMAKAFMNALYSRLFGPNARPSAELDTDIITAYNKLEWLGYRFCVVHVIVMSGMFKEYRGISVTTLLTAAKTRCPHLFEDMTRWQNVLPTPRAFEHQDAVDWDDVEEYPWDKPESRSYRVDQILMPLLFADLPFPTWYKAKDVVKEGDDVRSTVRKYLNM